MRRERVVSPRCELHVELGFFSGGSEATEDVAGGGIGHVRRFGGGRGSGKGGRRLRDSGGRSGGGRNGGGERRRFLEEGHGTLPVRNSHRRLFRDVD